MNAIANWMMNGQPVNQGYMPSGCPGCGTSHSQNNVNSYNMPPNNFGGAGGQNNVFNYHSATPQPQFGAVPNAGVIGQQSGVPTGAPGGAGGDIFADMAGLGISGNVSSGGFNDYYNLMSGLGPAMGLTSQSMAGLPSGDYTQYNTMRDQVTFGGGENGGGKGFNDYLTEISSYDGGKPS